MKNFLLLTPLLLFALMSEAQVDEDNLLIDSTWYITKISLSDIGTFPTYPEDDFIATFSNERGLFVRSCAGNIPLKYKIDPTKNSLMMKNKGIPFAPFVGQCENGNSEAVQEALVGFENPKDSYIWRSLVRDTFRSTYSIRELAPDRYELIMVSHYFSDTLNVSDTIYYTNVEPEPKVAIDIIQNESVNIFPNPVTEYFYVQGVGQIENIDIYNSLGVRMTTLEGNNTRYHIGTLQPGLYVALIHTGKGILTRQMMKL